MSIASDVIITTDTMDDRVAQLATKSSTRTSTSEFEDRPEPNEQYKDLTLNQSSLQTTLLLPLSLNYSKLTM